MTVNSERVDSRGVLTETMQREREREKGGGLLTLFPWNKGKRMDSMVIFFTFISFSCSSIYKIHIFIISTKVLFQSLLVDHCFFFRFLIITKWLLTQWICQMSVQGFKHRTLHTIKPSMSLLETVAWSLRTVQYLMK